MIEMPAVRCDHPDCTELATHKIASVWKDSRFSELKTYGFACELHTPEVYHKAEVRWLEYEPVPGESLGKLGIYHYEKGAGDRNLQHDKKLESTLIS